ncbi:hypothetical protein MMC07_005462 [Pseudocyphellaria aurata]|nr:hypothetical protein [Pseudocyphellaria aurata]
MSSNSSRNDSSSSLTSDLSISPYSALNVPLEAEERHYFHHFRQTCLPDLVSLIDADLWNHIMLKICAPKPAVQHAILALSAQHEAFLTRMPSKGPEYHLQNNKSAAFSCRQYSKAIKSLHSQLGDASKNAENLEEALAVCLVFIVIGILQGNYLEALMHLEGGLQILTNCYSSATLTFEHVSNDFSCSSLAKAFRRLDIQGASYAGRRNVKPFSVSLGQCLPSLVTASTGRSDLAFANVSEACDTLHTRIASAYHFMRSPARSLRKHSRLSSKWVMDLKYEPLLHATAAKTNAFSSVLQEQEILLDGLRRWAHAFEAFLKQSAAHTSNAKSNEFDIRAREQAQQYAMLWISYLIIFITLATLFEPDECAYDAFFPHFEDVVKHAEFVLFPESRDDRVLVGRKRFSMEMSVVHPLYFTALKCRNHALRQQAATLLHISGQEGVWDGSMLAAIANYIIEIEETERFLEVPSKSTLITELAPESEKQNFVILEPARVHGVALDAVDVEKGMVCVEFSKRNFAPTEDVINKVEGVETYKWVFNKKRLEGWNK